MAVLVHAPPSSLSMWHLDQPSTAFPLDSDGPAGNVSYYNVAPLEPSSVIPMFTPVTGAGDGPLTSSQSPIHTHGHESISLSKFSKLKRSTSTPNVRGQANTESTAMILSADKRRNKLGYHRTSVACGHCRRRKIRCIPAPGDHQNRCSNCIRLKKECNFYPVDQQAPLEPKRRSSKTQSTELGETSASSSPSLAAGKMPDMQTNVAAMQNRGAPLVQDLIGSQVKGQRTESISPKVKELMKARTYENAPTLRDWTPTQASPNNKGQFGEAPPYWRPANESPLTPAFSPFPPTTIAMPDSEWAATHSESMPRDDLSWSIPPRSLSYNNLDKINESQYGSFGPSHIPSDQYALKHPVVQTMYPSSTPVTAGPNGSQPRPRAIPMYPSWQPQYHVSGTAPVDAQNFSNWAPSQAMHLPLVTDGTYTAHHQYGYGEQQGTDLFSNQGHNR